MRRTATPLVLLFLVSSVVGAQRGGGAGQPPADAGPFGALRWRSLGPARGGRSIAVAGSASRIHEYYMGATGGGLWKTTDGGVTWRAVTDGQIHSSSVGAVAVAPSNPSAPARPTFAATSFRATAPTRRPTAARPGRTSGSRKRR